MSRSPILPRFRFSIEGCFSDTALKVDNAVAVLSGIVNQLSSTLSLGSTIVVTAATGTVATNGTVPALDKTITVREFSASNACFAEFANLMRR